MDLFLQKVSGSKLEVLYTTNEMKESIHYVCSELGVSMSDWLLNILNHHFRTFGSQYDDLIEKAQKEKRKKFKSL